MSGPVTYTHDETIAVIRMDDGKVNVIGPDMQRALNEAIDQADRDNVGALVIAGNHRVFSGGFDLKVLTSGEVQPAIDMLRGGFELAYRLLSYPKPVVMACTGHAIAMGAFLLTSGDHRVAAHAYNIQANEVAIGMTIPYAALEIMKLRLTPSAYQQAAGWPRHSSAKPRWRPALSTRSRCPKWCSAAPRKPRMNSPVSISRPTPRPNYAPVPTP
ncbi:enoyl-CoA hydratase, EchA3 [Mycobacterium kansasii]|uniref:Enoyl-CoA hydratase, EchA3 n=1 Tax=Mycobacterium kansasii TaxID=1768 RepID=A0A1V3WG15_MYCKA|nr:enoyl-CoA hydratase, EchA3 [Mycobacterium kansasii]